jgi:hypothetical protein
LKLENDPLAASWMPFAANRAFKTNHDAYFGGISIRGIVFASWQGK